ncbi:MAG: hypothetical protein K0R51_1175 [Cytophagaceae bacterium]|jgi:hypothetical protein|nr:hypothetical protein [Cytophagaceae bacterium]
MAENASNDIVYYVLISASQKNELASIRHWNNVKMGTEGNQIWLKDLNYVQIHSLEIKSLSQKSFFYAKGAKLFLLNSLLPDRNIPSLLWTSIDRALPVRLPLLNHNYFGISESVELRLVADDQERQTVAMITDLNVLNRYITGAPSVRLEKLSWTILDQQKVLLFGTPQLPIQGEVFWQKKEFLLPAGYDFDLFSLTDELNHAINSQHDAWIIWSADNSCFLVPKNDVQILSLSSFRLSVASL